MNQAGMIRAHLVCPCCIFKRLQAQDAATASGAACFAANQRLLKPTIRLCCRFRPGKGDTS